MNQNAAKAALNALEIILQFTATNGMSMRALLDEYHEAKAQGREFSVTDIENVRAKSRAELNMLRANVGLPTL